jgi:hypothetical protein
LNTGINLKFSVTSISKAPSWLIKVSASFNFHPSNSNTSVEVLDLYGIIKSAEIKSLTLIVPSSAEGFFKYKYLGIEVSVGFSISKNSTLIAYVTPIFS